MSSESTQRLDSRVRTHAALGDRGRLRIVDTLGLGDASPSELAALLDMPSNLLAHHLNVLETAGLVTRRRSDGDARRTYLRLRSEPLRDLWAAHLRQPARVVFVCTANSARSHLAAALWRSTSHVPATSAGTHPANHITAGARSAARRHGLPLEDVDPVVLSSVLRSGDLVVSVCDNAHEELHGLDQLHWSVPDPVQRGTASAYDEVIGDLGTRIQALHARVN